ncbi:MAG: hypothetical protein ACREJC_04190, partial [Tepidisphaeraceae bacterium]
MKDQLSVNQQDPPKKKSLIYLHAHGNVESRKVVLRNGYIPDTEGQGETYTPASAAVSLELLPDVVSDFFEGTLDDDPDLDSAGRPTLRITTSEEIGLVDPVSVFLDGIDIGQVDMDGSTLGGDYSLELSDSALTQMRDLGVLSDNLVDVSFGIPTGSFRVATEWDFDLRDLSHWGIGLTGPGLMGEVPEPASLLMPTVMMLIAIRQRRAGKC